jgi:hypothetical protein
MARQRRPVVARRAPQRRKRVWARDDSTLTLSAAGGANDLLADFAAAYGTTNAPPGTTIGGILLDFSFVQTSARAASEDGATIGIIVSSEATPAEVARPVGEPHADWMWYQFLGAPGAATAAGYSTASVMGGPLRIRSRRRMDELGMHLWLVGQTVGLTSYTLTYRASTLLIMP